MDRSRESNWPALALGEWSDTCDTLHLWTQMAGKVMLALNPFQNHFWHVGLRLSARGITTGTIPYSRGAFSIDFDFIDHRLIVLTSDGDTESVPLAPQSVATFYRRFQQALGSAGIEVAINPVPSEMPGPVPFDRDEAHASYDGEYVRRWWHILLDTERALRRQAGIFTGKASPVLFWWGGFDLNQALYSGRVAPFMENAPRFMALSEDRENVARGFWPGNATPTGFTMGEPAFYCYVYPEPDGFKNAAVRPAAARYVQELGQFILPYEAIRSTADPGQELVEFFQSTYEAAATLGRWDRKILEPGYPEALRGLRSTGVQAD